MSANRSQEGDSSAISAQNLLKNGLISGGVCKHPCISGKHDCIFSHVFHLLLTLLLRISRDLSSIICYTARTLKTC